MAPANPGDQPRGAAAAQLATDRHRGGRGVRPEIGNEALAVEALLGRASAALARPVQIAMCLEDTRRVDAREAVRIDFDATDRADARVLDGENAHDRLLEDRRLGVVRLGGCPPSATADMTGHDRRVEIGTRTETGIGTATEPEIETVPRKDGDPVLLSGANGATEVPLEGLRP